MECFHIDESGYYARHFGAKTSYRPRPHITRSGRRLGWRSSSATIQSNPIPARPVFRECCRNGYRQHDLPRVLLPFLQRPLYCLLSTHAKAINDTYGHATSDAVLKAVANADIQQQADQAMYLAKKVGRNRVSGCWAEVSMLRTMPNGSSMIGQARVIHGKPLVYNGAIIRCLASHEKPARHLGRHRAFRQRH